MHILTLFHFFRPGQASGASIDSGNDNSQAVHKIGVDVLLGGLILQLLSYVFFVCLILHTHWLVRRATDPDVKRISDEKTFYIVKVLYFSSVFIMVCHVPSWSRPDFIAMF